MRIAVICEGCGKRQEVDEVHAGKRGKCPRCGQVMTIPELSKPTPPLPEESDLYALAELPEAAPSTFVPSPARSCSGTEGERRRESRPPRTSDRDRSNESASPLRPTIRRVITIGLVAAVVLALLAALLPRGMMIVGMGVTIAGLLLTFYGYVTGAYIAFTEDSLHGWLYLLIPLYAGYYLVSRWEEMRSRLILVVVGLALLAVGGRIMEVGLARSGSAEPVKEGAAMIVPQPVERV